MSKASVGVLSESKLALRGTFVPKCSFDVASSSNFGRETLKMQRFMKELANKKY